MTEIIAHGLIDKTTVRREATLAQPYVTKTFY
jgi:hypothetical protein